MWKAKYQHFSHKIEYYRTVYGDSEAEANRIANKYARKGYRCVSLVKDDCND